MARSEEQKQAVDLLADAARDGLIDDFARLSKMINDRNYVDASLMAFGLANALDILSQGLAAEALVRKLEGRFDT